MTEQLLDDAQVGPALEQVRRERMAERVRADPAAEAGPPGRATDRRPGRLARETPAPVAQEQRPAADGRHVAALDERAGRGPSSQVVSQSRATSPIGTRRSLSPLPMTRTNAPSSERSSRSSPTASLTRRPAAYRSSSSARSRTPPSEAASSSRSTSPTSSVSGRRRLWRGRSRCAATSNSMRPSPNANR